MAESPVHYPPAPRGCDAADARHGGQFRTGNGVESGRGVYTRLLVDDGDIQQHNFLMELVDNPAGLRAINPAPITPASPSSRAGHRGSG